MPVYRVRLELRSGLGTPLAADTLWGHIAWGIRYRAGEQALNAWLDRYDAGDPPLVISDPLPEGFWPRPALPPVPRPVRPSSVAELDRRKRLDKIAWISHAEWQRVCRSVSPAGIHQAVRNTLEDALPPEPVGAAVAHAGINRLTGGTSQPEAGTLFTVPQSYYPTLNDRPRFDVWTVSPEPAETVRAWFEDGLLAGYGRDAATGLGHLVVLDVSAAEWPVPPHSNACVLLGPVVPKPNDPHRGFFKLGVKCGRLGGDFAVGPLPDGSTNRQKRPVRCLLAGTVLLTPSEPPLILGRLLSGVHDWPAIRHNGMAPVLPCRLDDDTLDQALPPESPSAASQESAP